MVRLVLARMADGRIHVLLSVASVTVLDRKVWLTDSQPIVLELHEETAKTDSTSAV